MNRSSVKSRIPVVILILLMAALVALTVCAMTLKPAAEAPQDVILPVHAMQETLRTAVPATPTPAPTIAPVPASDPPADADAQYPFWSEGELWNGNSYRSPTLSVDLKTVCDATTFQKRVTYYVADIHVSDVTQIRTEAYSGSFSRTRYGSVKTMADRVHALIAISGDYCGCHSRSLVIRNGEVYRTVHRGGDVCLLLKNGEMKTILSNEVNISGILKEDVWQAWEFGPALLNDKGEARTSFPSSDVTPTNPRSCIGCIEPGHYLFVVVDGRQKASHGLTLRELAKLMQSLGCKQAYNLDGGASAHMYWKGKIYNKPSKGGRSISDIIYIAKEPYDASRFFAGKKGRSK